MHKGWAGIAGGSDPARINAYVGDDDVSDVEHENTQRNSMTVTPQTGWREYADPPEDGTCAILYFPEHAEPDFDGLDYRYRLAIYREGGWRDQGTNHDSIEGFDFARDDLPTHYWPLPEAPSSSEERRG